MRAIWPRVLKLHGVDEYVAEILAGMVGTPAGSFEFAELAEWMSEHLLAGRRAVPSVGKQCKKCEYYCDPSERTAERRSSWAECIEQRFPGKGGVPRAETVLALYDDRKKKGEQALVQGKLLLTELNEDDVGEEESSDEIVLPHRHRLQIREARAEDAATLLRTRTLREAFDGWTFPLHFIDFETSRPTLPFTAGRHPNQQILFQFSHHVLDAAGRLEHRIQCLVTEPGVVLDDVRKQIAIGNVPDEPALAAFVAGLIGGVDGRSARLVDMGRLLVAKTAFIAGTDARSSIMKVLQAVMQQSEYLRDPYTLPTPLLSDPELDRAAREEEEDEASARGAAQAVL